MLQTLQKKVSFGLVARNCAGVTITLCVSEESRGGTLLVTEGSGSRMLLVVVEGGSGTLLVAGSRALLVAVKGSTGETGSGCGCVVKVIVVDFPGSSVGFVFGSAQGLGSSSRKGSGITIGVVVLGVTTGVLKLAGALVEVTALVLELVVCLGGV